jgi:hypothetical protein
MYQDYLLQVPILLYIIINNAENICLFRLQAVAHNNVKSWGTQV